MEKQKNIPALRFPEFKGGWESRKMSDIARFSKGKGISKSEISDNGTTKCIRYGELYTRYNEVINEVYSRTNIDVQDLILSEANDVIIPASGETQIDIATASCVIRSGIALGGDLNIIKTKNNGVFLSYYLNNRKKREIANLAQGISVVHLYSSQLATLSLNLPTLPEQKRIASFLSVIDQKTTQLKQKKTLLEQYKNSVMQKLFSQGLKFKDDKGKAFPKWETKKLDEVYSFKITNSFSRDNLNYETGKVKNIHYGDIHTKFSTLFDITKENVPFINSEVNIKRISNENYCVEGDLIFADASEDLNNVGKSIELVYLNNEKLLAGLHTILARPIDSYLSIGFSGYLFKWNNIRLQIQKEAQGSKVLSISASRLSNIQLPIPCLAEQIKIVNFLSAIDEKIVRTDSQLQQTEQYKKGLLQKMFV